MKRLTRKQWKGRRVYNSYDVIKLCLDPQVYISYRPQNLGRASISAGWQVIHLKLKTDPSGHWMNYGNQTFMVDIPSNKAEKQAKLVKAKKFAKQYGIVEWERGFDGDWYPKGSMERARKMTRPSLS